MEYTTLGNTDIKVSKICVGCMSFGKAGTMHDWTLDEKESLASSRLTDNAHSSIKYEPAKSGIYLFF